MKITGEILLLLLLTTLIHESGHIIVMKMIGMRFRRIQIFFVNLVEINFNTFVLAFGLIPVGGYTLPDKLDWDYCPSYKRAWVLLAGAVFNIIAALIAFKIDGAFWFDFAAFNLAKGILNLIPVPGTDGHKLITLNR